MQDVVAVVVAPVVIILEFLHSRTFSRDSAIPLKTVMEVSAERFHAELSGAHKLRRVAADSRVACVLLPHHMNVSRLLIVYLFLIVITLKIAKGLLIVVHVVPLMFYPTNVFLVRERAALDQSVLIL